MPVNLVKPTKRRVFNKVTGVFAEQDSSDNNSSIYSESEEDEVFLKGSSLRQKRIQTDGPAIVLPSERKNSKLHDKVVPIIYG